MQAVKAIYTFSDKVSLMAGIFNNYWNTYTSYRTFTVGAGPTATTGISSGDVSTFGAQLTLVTPAKGWTAYIKLINRLHTLVPKLI